MSYYLLCPRKVLLTTLRAFLPSFPRPVLSALFNSLHSLSSQAESFWEDAFTGICYCRARWLLRAPEVLRDVSEDEVVLTTVTDTIDATSILGLAPIGLPTANPKTEPPAPAEAGAPASDRVLRARISNSRKGKGRRRMKNVTLFLSRSFDPFTVVFADLPTDHPALVQLRLRAGAKTATHCDDSRESEKGATGPHQKRGPGRPRKAIAPRFSARGSPRKSAAADRVGAERKGLNGASLAVRPGPGAAGGCSESGSISSSSGSSVSVGGNSCGMVSSCSNSGFTSGDSEDDEDELDFGKGISPTARRRKKEAVAAAAVAKTGAKPVVEPVVEPVAEPVANPVANPVAPVPAVQLPERPRRLAMPPGETPDSAGEAEASDDVGNQADATPADVEIASALSARKPLMRGGPLVREAHLGEDLVEGAPSPMTGYRQRETDVGEEHQADIPPLLTEAQRAVEKGETTGNEMGCALVSAP